MRNLRHICCHDLLELQLQPHPKAQRRSTKCSDSQSVSSQRLVAMPYTKFYTEEPKMVSFPVYLDSSLPFLDRDTEIGREFRKAMVPTDFDDDCATDDDM